MRSMEKTATEQLQTAGQPLKLRKRRADSPKRCGSTPFIHHVTAGKVDNRLPVHEELGFLRTRSIVQGRCGHRRGRHGKRRSNRIVRLHSQLVALPLQLCGKKIHNMAGARSQQVRLVSLGALEHHAIRQKRLTQARRLLDATAICNEQSHEPGKPLWRKNPATVIQELPEL